MPSGVVDEIKSKIDIVQLVAEHLQLKKAGSAWKAPCPFHNEKSPSFMVNPERQRFHCFGCGEDGDIFGFIERIEGVDFTEALKTLAKKAGVVLRKEDVGLSNERQLLMDINRWAARFFHEILLRSPQAEGARAYVAKRLLKEETTEDWLIGYAPDSWDTALNFLRKKGYKDDDIFRAGLVSKSERGTGYFDRFRGRLMFPIRDVNGNVVGFTARLVPDAKGNEPKDSAKYVNTAQTLIYNKSAILFGLDKAKKEIRKKEVAVVVEGNMDVIASHQAGVTHVVGSSGTAFTADQLAILKRYAPRLVLSFDNDAAGETAARRSIDAAVAAGFPVRILRLPPGAGKDPDDCIRKDPALWSKAIADAVPFMEWYMDLAKERTDPSDPHAKREAADALLRETAKLGDPVEESHWVRRLAEMFETPESLLFEKLQRLKGHSGGPVGPAPKPVAKAEKREERSGDRFALVSEYILAIFLAWPEYAETVIDAIAPDVLDEGLRDLYRALVVHYNERRLAGNTKQAADRIPFKPEDAATAEKIAVLELRAQKEFGDLTGDERRQTLAKLTGECKRLHVTRRQIELTRAMAQAEKAGDAARIKEIQEQLGALML